jgi:hypothetical protein
MVVDNVEDLTQVVIDLARAGDMVALKLLLAPMLPALPGSKSSGAARSPSAGRSPMVRASALRPEFVALVEEILGEEADRGDSS